MDKIVISNLKVDTIIGTLPAERKEIQTLLLNIELYLPLTKSGKSDDLFDSIDYWQVENNIIAMGEKTKFFLIERFAQEVANLCLEDKMISSVKIEVIKIGALKHSGRVAVCIERSQKRK